MCSSDLSITGADKSTDASLPASDTYENFGSSTDLWNVSWTAADINSSGFGVGFSVKSTYLTSNGFIDHIRITVYYTAALPTIQFTTTSSSGAESVTPAQLGLTLSATFSSNVTVDYAITGTATGGGVDYTLANGTATITAGNSTTTIDAVIINDSLDESDETIIVTISNPTNATLGTNTVHTYTILDNDTAGVTVNPTSGLTTTEAGGTATFTDRKSVV